MDSEIPHIISVWQVDPVGGVWVDWPGVSDVDGGIFTPASWDAAVWRSEAIRLFSFSVLSQLADEISPFFWCNHDLLPSLLTDCNIALDNAAAISDTCGVSTDEFIRSMNQLRVATDFATSIVEAGVCIT
jgi:hypothetical protein